MLQGMVYNTKKIYKVLRPQELGVGERSTTGRRDCPRPPQTEPQESNTEAGVHFCYLLVCMKAVYPRD